MKKIIDKQYVIEQISSGKTVSEIANFMSVHRCTLSRKIKEWGVQKKPTICKDSIVKDIRLGKTVNDIAKSLMVSRGTISKRLKFWGINKTDIKFNQHFFDKIDTEAKAYWLGFIMADGCVSRTHNRDKVMICVAEKDKHHLQKWHNAIGSRLPVRNRGDGAYQSQHYSSHMCDALENIGCVQRKSLILEFPDIDERLLHHFVRGYFDGDGSVGLKKKTLQLRMSIIGTESFLKSLSNILCLNNKLQPAGNNKVLEVGGNNKVGKIMAWMYKDATIFLERKREVYFGSL